MPARRLFGIRRRVRGGAGAALMALMAGAFLAGCTSGPSSTAPTTSVGGTRAAVGPGAAIGPSARLVGPITAGHILEPLSTHSVDLATYGYVEQEFFASGTATAFGSAGALSTDGFWSVKPQATAFYRTRIIVRRPADASRFNGTVIVEWLNVSAGLEVATEWTYLSDELVHDGYAWVGVSAQALGIDGGAGLLALGNAKGGGLVREEPKRYGTLVHPGDRFALDIFAQIGIALRGGGDPALGPLHPQAVIAAGESQSAFFLTTFADAVQPITNAYSGFLIHSRSGSAATLSGAPLGGSGLPSAVHIRTDTRVPVFMFETETDVGPLLRFQPALQPNTDEIRTWEVAGTSHADAYQLGAVSGPDLGCHFVINDGPEHDVLDAAFHALDEWVRAGVPPPEPPPFRMTGNGSATIARDSLGIAIGGVRTPEVEVPVAVLTGQAHAGANLLCSLFGSTVPFSTGELHRLYNDKSRYLAEFDASLRAAIAAGYVESADGPAMMAEAGAVSFGATRT